MKFDRLGKAQASFASEGINMEAFEKFLTATITEVYLHIGQETNADDGVLIRQQVGVPMGGKASLEIANVFCYSVEAAFLDRCLPKAKSKRRACGP